MGSGLYRFLKVTAVVLAIAWVGWAIYESFFRQSSPGDRAYYAAGKLFEDGAYRRALEQYDLALQLTPNHIHALRGRARTLMQLGRNEVALSEFTRAIELQPDFAATYANRGILYDRMGQYKKAIVDYEKALQLDSDLANGPYWLTRFLRLQPEKPPTIEDRARYLREQLAKPESERLLRVPDIDQKQRPYKL